MKRTRLRRVSKKTAARFRACKPFRDRLIQEVGRCEICGHDPRRVRLGDIAWTLSVHEIANGADRQKALDKRYAVLVVCYRCHDERMNDGKTWPKARQLAALKRSRPQDYDLVAYRELVGLKPSAITEADVDRYMENTE